MLFRTQTAISCGNIFSMCGEEFRLVNPSPQFSLDTDGTDWFVEPGSSIFKTHINSTPLIKRTKLNDGDVLSIFQPSSPRPGEQKAILAVSITLEQIT